MCERMVIFSQWSFPSFLGYSIRFYFPGPLTVMRDCVYRSCQRNVPKWSVQHKARLLRRLAFSTLSICLPLECSDNEMLRDSGVIWGKFQPCVEEELAAQEQPLSTIMWVKNKLFIIFDPLYILESIYYYGLSLLKKMLWRKIRKALPHILDSGNLHVS